MIFLRLPGTLLALILTINCFAQTKQISDFSGTTLKSGELSVHQVKMIQWTQKAPRMKHLGNDSTLVILHTTLFDAEGRCKEYKWQLEPQSGDSLPPVPGQGSSLGTFFLASECHFFYNQQNLLVGTEINDPGRITHIRYLYANGQLTERIDSGYLPDGRSGRTGIWKKNAENWMYIGIKPDGNRDTTLFPPEILSNTGDFSALLLMLPFSGVTEIRSNSSVWIDRIPAESALRSWNIPEDECLFSLEYRPGFVVFFDICTK
jgi:hypothetical protein